MCITHYDNTIDIQLEFFDVVFQVHKNFISIDPHSLINYKVMNELIVFVCKVCNNKGNLGLGTLAV